MSSSEQEMNCSFGHMPVHLTENHVHSTVKLAENNQIENENFLNKSNANSTSCKFNHQAKHKKEILDEEVAFLRKRQSFLCKRGNTDLSIDHTGCQRFLPRFLRFAFADQDAETLYREYYENEKRNDFKTLVGIILIVNSSLLALRILDLNERLKKEFNIIITLFLSTFVLILIYFLIKCRLTENQRKLSIQLTNGLIPSLDTTTSCPQASLNCKLKTGFQRLFNCDFTVWHAIPYLIWFVVLMEIYFDLKLFNFNAFQPEDSLAFLLLFTYAIYVIFPLRLCISSILAILTSIIYLVFLICMNSQLMTSWNLIRLLGSNFGLIFCVNFIGLMSYFFYEKRQRRAFLETCICLEHKLQEEEASQEQERLLLSVLPKHVAAEIRQDLGSDFNGQFKKIYMSRHENVSILFADIVGFTAISSTLSAPELVKILNELFARFDKLADKYHQLRIKILGDCYYCISGAPEQRPDHAVLCVHMGLSMVEAIKSVREQTKSGVDMRVGIHTGGVLAGVLGQKQWQFDVYSKDVELANKMESGGLPGRVHISESTVKYLNNEFELIDGEGASREETIRLAGIKTYLIVKVLKPYPQGTLDFKEENEKTDENSCKESDLTEHQKLLDANNKQTFAQTLLDGHHCATKMINSNSEEATINQCSKFNCETSSSSCDIKSKQNKQEYNRRLRFELLNRENSHFYKKTRPLTLCFIDENYERQYMDNTDETAGVSFAGLPISLFLCLFSELCFNCLTLNSSLTLLCCTFLLFLLALTCTAPCWAGRRDSIRNDCDKQNSIDSTKLINCKTNLNEYSMQEINFKPKLHANLNKCDLNLDIEKNKKQTTKSINKFKFNDERISLPDWLPKPILSISLAVQTKSAIRLVISTLMISIWLIAFVVLNFEVQHQNALHQMQLNETSQIQFNRLISTQEEKLSRMIRNLENEVLQDASSSTEYELNSMINRPAWFISRNLKKTRTLTSSENDEDKKIWLDSELKSIINRNYLLDVHIFYLDYYTVVFLLAISALKRISFLWKMCFIFCCTLIQIMLNLFLHKTAFKHFDLVYFDSLWSANATTRPDELDTISIEDLNSSKLNLTHLTYIVFILSNIMIACFVINRQFELMSRRLFLWQKEVEEQIKKVAEMKRKNEALLYNILPPHVAIHFLGRSKRDEELYSKSYNSVGVLFAAVSNFTDFYTEESVNNQGLECLRFLNEVISDYDELLDQERFKNIIKIKTMSSTYMAASGLNCEQDYGDDEPDLKKRWSHLAKLTEFALTLKETLNNLNKESFNNFVLKMGINQGPITAGVIGARKPHFDMWGNTVNVASRMESTGKAGCIQVVQETADILKLFGFKFEPRGLVSVKGKGKLITYYLVDSK